MKSLIFSFALLGGTWLFEQNQTTSPAPKTKSTSAAKKSAKKTTAPPAPAFLTVPADATANPDGTYSYTDKAGRKWNYWKSPFGVMRSEVPAGAPAQAAPTSGAAPFQYTSSTDKGDSVRFERQTPFGPVGYDRKKSEMTDAERGLFEKQHPESKQTKPE